MGVGMGPMLGLPGMDFQNQIPARPPHMEQTQFGHHQAPPMSAPPQYTGQQNAGNPTYQPNGYIPQSQKQLGRGNGYKKRRPDDRRDSMNSNGSRNKVRDDPIHGPVYALNSRKDSNTSTGRQSSNSDGFPAIDPTHPASNPNLECKNHRHDEKLKKKPSEFVDCPCFRCVRSSRSLFVRHDNFPAEDVKAALMNYLGGWGAVQVVVQNAGFGSLVV